MDTVAANSAAFSETCEAFEGRLQRLLNEAQARSELVGLLLVQAAAIDRVDATHGFSTGDRIASTIFDLLRTKVLRKSDLIGRISRDHMACVLHPLSSEAIAFLGATRVLSVLEQRIEVEGASIRADPAIGIAVFPGHAVDARQFLQRAKSALSLARCHRDRIAMHCTPDEAPSPVSPLAYEDRLRIALEENLLALHFQPQFDLRRKAVVSAEALLRWHDPVLGFVPPNVALQAAEASGLMDRLTMWVISSGVRHCAEFRRVRPDFSVSVNISPSNLREPDLPWHVDRELRTWDVPGHAIVIEITETAMMVEQALAHEALRQLKRSGVRLSVDDFGTGYSSMQYLAELPLDELKIDLVFVKTMLERAQNRKIVRSMIDLAHNLDLEVVAEGVENVMTLEALAALGCDIVQGYHIAKPMTGDNLSALLQDGAKL